jgi:2-polyprenyl-3-methyl-5-hydroxy-6-metoxy-1,4-benzoquinol methylase
MNFKDLFSNHADAYAKYRPHYPKELFDYLASQCKEKKLVWDCGAGNGQASTELAKYFDKVYASDPSEKKLPMRFMQEISNTL